MNWNQLQQIERTAMDELRGRTHNKPYTKHSGPMIGGISPPDPDDDTDFISPPSFVSAKFVVESTGKNPSLKVHGDSLRQIRQRLGADQSHTTTLLPMPFEPKSFAIKGDKQESGWTVPKNTIMEPGSRRYRLRDPGLEFKIDVTTEGSENTRSINVVFHNTSGNDASILYDFDFVIDLQDCKLIKRAIGKLDDERDVPLTVQTIGCVADIGQQRIELRPVGSWDQERNVIATGPSFEEALVKPFEAKELGQYRADFESAARIATKAMQKVVKSTNYHKFQFDLRGKVYEQAVKGWKDGILRAVIDNAPTAAGKTEVNSDAAIVLTLVKKKHAPDGDCGTVAVIIEPIRALAAEQLERLFRFVAYVNEQLPESQWITMGFFMGTQSVRGIPSEPSSEITMKQVPITTCPVCEKELSLEYLQVRGRLIPKCDNCKKSYPWVYLTVKETKQLLPNIVVATLDKLCWDEGRELEVHTFFGREYVRCPKTDCKRAVPVTSKVLRGEGACWYCRTHVDADKARKSMFSLLVIDEAHSFRGSLGSNAGLYTTTELQLSKELLTSAPLVLASTATVKRAGELLKHLTGAVADQAIVLPSENEEDKYFKEDKNQPHRRFVFVCPNVSNRVVIPRAVGTVKAAWDAIRKDGDPEKLPQIVFTKKRQNAENLGNAVQILGEVDNRHLEIDVIHGENDKREVKEALRKIEHNEIDVLFVTLDLIALGIDIPSISVIHFDGMPDDFAKFIQAYGRSARGKAGQDAGLIFTWLRMNIPGEAYYFEHFRDLFIYKKQLMPSIPINRWFPQSIRRYIPAAAFQTGFFRDQKASMFSTNHTARQLTNNVYKNELQDFIVQKVLNDVDDPVDEEIARRYTLLGLQDVHSHIQGQLLSTVKDHKQLLEKILPRGIRSQANETVIMPTNFDRTLMSIKVEKRLLSAGFTEYELGIGGDD